MAGLSSLQTTSASQKGIFVHSEEVMHTKIHMDGLSRPASPGPTPGLWTLRSLLWALYNLAKRLEEG